MADTDDKGQPRLSADEMFPLIDQINAWGDVQHIAFDTIGEPFLDKSFTDYVAHANRLGLSTSTVTNGTAMTEARALEVLKSGLRYMSFSIDSPIAAIHDEIRGLKGGFDKTVRTIRLMQRLKSARRAETGKDEPVLMVICVVSRDNFREIDLMAELVRDLGVPRLRLVYAATVDEDVKSNLEKHSGADANAHRFWLPTDDLHIDEEDKSLLLEKLGLLACKCNNYQIGLDLAINAANITRPCPVLWQQTFVDKFGNVYPCPMMTDTHLGNVRETPLEEIWNSDEYNELRKLLHRRNTGEVELQICDRCCTFSRIATRPSDKPLRAVKSG
ncbi:MAG: radical SAM/SPASM domain-containing protein, partial [Woeseiaceae bacterium]